MLLKLTFKPVNYSVLRAAIKIESFWYKDSSTYWQLKANLLRRLVDLLCTYQVIPELLKEAQEAIKLCLNAALDNTDIKLQKCIKANHEVIEFKVHAYLYYMDKPSKIRSKIKQFYNETASFV